MISLSLFLFVSCRFFDLIPPPVIDFNRIFFFLFFFFFSLFFSLNKIESTRHLYGMLCDSVNGRTSGYEERGLFGRLREMSSSTTTTSAAAAAVNRRSAVAYQVKSSVVVLHCRETRLDARHLRNSLMNVLDIMVPTERVERLVQLLSSSSGAGAGRVGAGRVGGKSGGRKMMEGTFGCEEFLKRFQRGNEHARVGSGNGGVGGGGGGVGGGRGGRGGGRGKSSLAEGQGWDWREKALQAIGKTLDNEISTRMSSSSLNDENGDALSVREQVLMSLRAMFRQTFAIERATTTVGRTRKSLAAKSTRLTTTLTTTTRKKRASARLDDDVSLVVVTTASKLRNWLEKRGEYQVGGSGSGSRGGSRGGGSGEGVRALRSLRLPLSSGTTALTTGSWEDLFIVLDQDCDGVVSEVRERSF